MPYPGGTAQSCQSRDAAFVFNDLDTGEDTVFDVIAVCGVGAGQRAHGAHFQGFGIYRTEQERHQDQAHYHNRNNAFSHLFLLKQLWVGWLTPDMPQ